MKIRLARPHDLDEISEVYTQARSRMVESGNPNQWINGYPSREVILRDIEDQSLYIGTQHEEVLGCVVFTEGDDPTYQNIDEGSWLNDNAYSVIHRLAVSSQGRGVGRNFIEWCIRHHSNIRGDTHADNLPMQNLLKKAGFHPCGIIRNAWGDERVAFHGVFNNEP